MEALISERRLGDETDEDDKDTIALFDEYVFLCSSGLVFLFGRFEDVDDELVIPLFSF